MKKPTLIIMAAGMGSRFGGLKQIEPITSEGEIILDFSLYDAMLAGFDDVIIVIKKENEKDFRKLIDDRAGKHLNIKFAYQDICDLPEGYDLPDGRTKPWGTAHAVMSARDLVNGPFAVINADDYYGQGAFQTMYDFLANIGDNSKYQYAMIGYMVENTLTENGYVSRGVCQTSEEDMLTSIVERTKIMQKGSRIVYENVDGEVEIPKGTVVSMNFWGFTESMMKEMAERFPKRLNEILASDAQKGEYFLPSVVDELIKENKADVKVLKSMDRWYGVTYKEDKESIVNAVRAMKDKGEYPEFLWE